MFVDASAIVAILTHEPGVDARAPITSPIALFEAALGICRKRHASLEEAEADVREFLEVAGVELVRSLRRKPRRHSLRFRAMAKDAAAQLNLGDCLAYAVAKNHRRALLFEGDDFDKTDIRS